MLIRLTIYNVAESTESNSAIGLVSGNLLWASAALTGYKVGIVDQKSFSGLTRSVSNIVNGGTFSTGYTGTIKVTAKNATLAAMVLAKSLTLNGKTLKLEISENGTEWVTEAQFPITNASVSDELTVLLKVATETLADKKKISSVVVTKEMALNNANSGAIGKTVQSTFGNKVYFPLIYCAPSQINSAVMIASNGYSYLQPSPVDILFNGEAMDPLTETYPMWAPDFSFAKGSSILQCCGAWQSSADSNVWLAFTFNGKELLASSLAGNATYLPLLKKAFIGQRIKVVFGGGRGDYHTIENLEFANHEVTFASTDINTLWFQVNTPELAKFNYTLPNYTLGGVGQGTTALQVQRMLPLPSFGSGYDIVKTNTFVESGSDKGASDISQISFVNNFEFFIASSSANVSSFELFAKVDNLLQKIAIPYGAEVIYKALEWQLLKVPFELNEENSISENTAHPLDSYIFENDTIAVPQDSIMNRVWSQSPYFDLASNSDNFQPGFTELGTPGIATFTDGFERMTEVKTANTLYSPITREMLDESASVCVVPKFDIKIANNFYGEFIYNFTANLEIKTFAVSEGNIILLEKTATAGIVFASNTLEGEPYAGSIFVKPEDASVIFSEDVVSHKTTDPDLYKTLASALTFSSGELCENKNQIRGFVTSVSVHYVGTYTICELDSRNLAKTFYTSYLSTSKSFDKSNLYLKCVDSSEVSAPIGIVERIAELGTIPCDVDSFAATETAQRAYFGTTAANFDGQYSPSSEESVSDAIDNICKKSMTCVLVGKDGTLKSKFLPLVPSEVSHIFTGNDIIKNSLTISQGDTSSAYCDFDFATVEDIASEKQTVAINTAVETFPLETDVPLGTIEITTAAGYSFAIVNGFGTSYKALLVRGPSRDLISMFVPGTYWHFSDAVGARVLRIDSIAPDIACPMDSFGIRIACIQISGLVDNFLGNVEARLWGPNKAWRDVVSGNAVQSYTLAKSMWETARNARERLGSEIKAPSSITEMEQPVWGSDKLALTNWMNATIQYCAKEKFVLKFETEATQELMSVDVLDYVSFAWGVFAANSVNGYVAEKSENLEKGTFGFTLICYGTATALPLLLTEAGIPFSEESGILFELEDSSTESQKISELTESTPEALAEADAYIPTATDAIANNKVSLAAIGSWISDPINATISALTAIVANKVDKTTTALQTMLGGLKLPFINFLSSLTGVLPTGAGEGAVWYNGVLKRLTIFDNTKNQPLAHLEDTYRNAGVIKQPTITKGANSITVGDDAIIRCYTTTDYSGIIQEIANPTGGTFALAQNTPLWLVYTYGEGYSIVSSIPTGPLSNVIPIFRYFNAFGVIHSSTQDELAKGATEKMLVRIANTEYFRRVGDVGIELSTSGLNVLVSGGAVYNGPVEENVLPFDSATGNLYRVDYDDGVWAQSVMHALTNTHYNPSTGLASLNSNKYTWAYVWRSIGDDVEAFFQLGEKEYATEALAIDDIGVMPTNIFGLYATHCVLVGYVLIRQGTASTKFFTAWDRPTVAGIPIYASNITSTPTGDVAATDVQSAIAELASEKLSASVASTTYAPRETTLSDETASKTLPSTGLATIVGLLQTVRNCLEYLVANMLDKLATADQSVAGRVFATNTPEGQDVTRICSTSISGARELQLFRVYVPNTTGTYANISAKYSINWSSSSSVSGQGNATVSLDIVTNNGTVTYNASVIDSDKNVVDKLSLGIATNAFFTYIYIVANVPSYSIVKCQRVLAEGGNYIENFYLDTAPTISYSPIYSYSANPVATSNDNTVPTTAWVKDVCGISGISNADISTPQTVNPTAGAFYFVTNASLLTIGKTNPPPRGTHFYVYVAGNVYFDFRSSNASHSYITMGVGVYDFISYGDGTYLYIRQS